MATDTRERHQAIEGFVEQLSRLRQNAGTPSFREMAKRSGAISHATLHDALQGVRMPSWETTVEFAKACGSDPRELRSEWEQAVAIVRATCQAQEPGTRTPDADVVTEIVAGPTTEAAGPPEQAGPTPPSTDHPPTRRPVISWAICAAAVALALGLAFVLLTREAPPGEASPPPRGEAAAAYESAPNAPSTTMSAAGCPENVKVAPGTTTLYAGDESDFVRDVTVDDCSVQPRGHSVVKTWELKNAGTVPWTDRSLHRINAHEGDPGCRSPERVAVPDTAPGDTVQVSVTIATPAKETVCFARWMQTDADGNFTFPEQRPYYYTFKVE